MKTTCRQLWGRNIFCSPLYISAIVCVLKGRLRFSWPKINQSLCTDRCVCFHIYLASSTIVSRQIFLNSRLSESMMWGYRQTVVSSLSLRQRAFVTTFLSSQSCWWLYLLGICLLVLAHSVRQNHHSHQGLADFLSSTAAVLGHFGFYFQGRRAQRFVWYSSS